MKNFTITLVMIIVVFSSYYLNAQKQGQAKIDSLLSLLQIAKDDTNKVNILNDLSRTSIDIDPNESVKYGQTAKNLSIKLQFKKGIANSLKCIGRGYYFQGKYIEAIDNWIQSLEQYKILKDDIGISNLLNNIGAIYFETGDDPKALEFYLRSLSIAEKTGDKLRIGTALVNIGAVYGNKAVTADKALEYYLRSLPLFEQVDDKDAIGINSANIGEIYLNKGDLKSAQFYFEKSIKAFSVEDNINMPFTLNNLGKVYLKRNDFKTAEAYILKALKISRKFDAKLQIVQSLIALADIFEQLREFNIAIKYYKEAEIIANEIGPTYELAKILSGLANAYSRISDYSNAFKYQKHFTSIKDSLYNIETDKKLSGLQFNFDLEKKQTQINILEKDGKLQELEIIRSKNERWVLFGGIAFLILVSIIILRQRSLSEKLLLNILPAKIAKRLKRKERQIADNIDQATIIFIDLAGFTEFSRNKNASDVLNTLNNIFSRIDKLVTKHGLEKIKTIGDGYMVASGVPESRADHALAAASFALETKDEIINFNNEKKLNLNPRIGIDCGPVVAGVIGDMKFIYDLWGDTVNTASRMESNGETGKIQITERFREKLMLSNGNLNFKFEERGEIEIKGKGLMRTYWLE